MSKELTNIQEPMKSWWIGDPRVEPYMKKVSEALHRNNIERPVYTDIYNRAYEAVYEAIIDHAGKLK